VSVTTTYVTGLSLVVVLCFDLQSPHSVSKPSAYTNFNHPQVVAYEGPETTLCLW